MNDLIEALQILAKHMDDSAYSPTHCEHDILLVMCDKQELPEEDVKKLDELGFFFSKEHYCWASFRFGSA